MHFKTYDLMLTTGVAQNRDRRTDRMLLLIEIVGEDVIAPISQADALLAKLVGTNEQQQQQIVGDLRKLLSTARAEFAAIKATLPPMSMEG